MMNFHLAKLLPVLVTASLVVGCEAEISGSSGKAADAGRADFSTYVAVGDSLTAGYGDGALYRSIQQSSMAQILAQQFALAGGGEFDQPLMPVGATGSLNLGGTDLGRIDRVVLKATGDPDSPASPQTFTPVQSTDIQVKLAGAGTFNNIGVPGAKSFHMGIANYGDPAGLLLVPPTANPYFVRFAATSMLVDASSQVPSFFTYWIGNNDIMLYALDGGSPNNTLPPYGTGTTDITDPTVFAAFFNSGLATLKTPTNKGVLINLPGPASVPYFTTVPYNAIPMTQAQANTANLGFAGYNLVVQTRVGLAAGGTTCGILQPEADQRVINFAAGQNAIVILDETLTDLTGCFLTAVKMRQATVEDYVVLPTSSKLGKDSGGGLLWGISEPLLDADVLIKIEFDQVETARAAYNATIKAAADADADLLLFDAAAKLVELDEDGIVYGSGGVTSAFAQGGAYSLDGFHPTARGNAVIANEIFKVINEGFDAFIPPVDPSDYTTVFYQ
jgi:lysophospholipase L1-like esterase